MPEEIKNEIVNETVMEAVEAIVATPKKGRAGKIAGVVTLVAGVAALGYWAYNKAKEKRNSKEAKTADGEVRDNVKIAERDCLDCDESEE